MHRLISFRGKQVRVGAVRQPSALALAEQAAKGWFHELFGLTRDPSNNAGLVVPASLPALIPSAAAANATMLANGPDPSAPSEVAAEGTGDCMWAADVHACATRACYADAPFLPTPGMALAGYASTGYVLGNAVTDQGTDPTQLIAYRKAGNPYPDGSVLLDAVSVDASNRSTLSEGIYLASGVQAWLSLPDKVLTQEDPGDVWDVCGPPNPDNGHGVFLSPNYTDVGPMIVTWGELVQATWQFAAAYMVARAGGGAFAPLDGDSISKITGKCPAGADLTGLTNYLAKIRAAS